MNQQYDCEAKAKEEMIAEIIDNVIAYMEVDDYVTVPLFGKGNYFLDIYMDENSDIRFFTCSRRWNERVYKSQYHSNMDINGIRDELLYAWEYTETQITDIVHTGGNIMTISGIAKGGKYFVCDQYGDGCYLAEPYNIDWTYDEISKVNLGSIDEDEIEDILYLYEMNYQ